ncbi:MAG: hypothetical protein Q7T65_12080 [Thiobacillus sp.]|nr:hypothetical protein [Thiobacillus sp.]
MKTLHYSATINAPRKLVWDVMLGAKTFTSWTSAFAEGSYFEGSWDEGQKIRFLIPDGSGMVSMIARNRPYEFISIQHLGVIKDGIEDTQSEAARNWAPAYENYTFSDAGTATGLKIDVDAPPDFEAFMEDAWPKALAKLKALCEAGA